MMTLSALSLRIFRKHYFEWWRVYPKFTNKKPRHLYWRGFYGGHFDVYYKTTGENSGIGFDNNRNYKPALFKCIIVTQPSKQCLRVMGSELFEFWGSLALEYYLLRMPAADVSLRYWAAKWCHTNCTSIFNSLSYPFMLSTVLYYRVFVSYLVILPRRWASKSLLSGP